MRHLLGFILRRQHTRSTWRTMAAAMTLVMVTLTGTHHAKAQVLSGPWVQKQDQRIDELRKTPLRVIVIDALGRPVPGAQVHLAMQRHDFAFGVRLDASRFSSDDLPDISTMSDQEAELWKLMSAVSIEDTAAWSRLESEPGKLDWTLADRMLRFAAGRGLPVRWGEVISADPSRLPVWLTALSDEALALAMQDHVARVARHLHGRAAQWDVMTRLADHNWPQQRLGQAIPRMLMLAAQRHSPQVVRSVRFSDTLTGPRLATMVQTLNELRDAQIPFNAVSIDARFTGMVAYAPLEESLTWLGQLGLPVHLTNLEVGGPTADAAAINLETILRLSFAQPAIHGIWLHGLRPEEVLDAASALLADDGTLTPAGRLFTRLVGEQWWTDEVHQADALGNVHARVFAGAYHLHAVWPGGQARTQAYIPTGTKRQLIVMQALGGTTAANPSSKGSP